MNSVASAPPFPPGGFGGFNHQNNYYGNGGPATPQQQINVPGPSQAFAGPGYQQNGGNPAQKMAAMPPSMMQPFGQQPSPFTTAPFGQALPAHAPAAPLPAHQQQQQHFRQSSSASPRPVRSPNNVGFPQQSVQQSPPNRYPMAAPPLPQSPAHAQQPAGSSASPVPGTPQSPSSHGREQQRIALLLDINMDLLQEVHRLQAQGKGGAISPQQMAQLKNEGKQADMASEEYMQVLRRVQANLAYLMPKAQNDSAKTPPGPAHMTPPPHMPHMQSKYDQLFELFAGWQGFDRRQSGATSGSPQPHGGFGAAFTSAGGTPA
ncbi:hypothetical protein KC357_g2139 [Hortaea werneckii]|nr:hypothetical protein KC357_g2139 [Hortaea werneckii]